LRYFGYILSAIHKCYFGFTVSISNYKVQVLTITTIYEYNDIFTCDKNPVEYAGMPFKVPDVKLLVL